MDPLPGEPATDPHAGGHFLWDSRAAAGGNAPTERDAVPKKKLPEHVKKYFERRGLDPDTLSENVNDRLADASVSEIKLLDDLGSMLENDPGPNKEKYAFVVH